MRLYVKISDDLGEKLAKYATDFGMSKSGFVAYALGNHISNLEHQQEIYNGLQNKVVDIVDKMAQEPANPFSSLEK